MVGKFSRTAGVHEVDTLKKVRFKEGELQEQSSKSSMSFIRVVANTMERFPAVRLL